VLGQVVDVNVTNDGRQGDFRAGSVYLNSFSGLISGISALVMKVMDPRSGTA